MPKMLHKSTNWLVLISLFLLSTVLLAGCGDSITTTGASGETTKKQSGSSDQGDVKVLAIGEKGATEKAEVTVKKVTTTGNLDSPEG